MINRFDLVVTRHGARFMGRHFACSIGRGGICAPEDKREGDGATPAGVHQLVGLFYHPARLPRPCAGALPTSPALRWSDDSRDPDYNHLVRLPHRFSHENLQRPDPLYDLVIVTDWNWPLAEAGRGSAIFVHTWRRPRYPTAGCAAFARPDLLWIADNLRPETRLVVKA